MRRLGVRIELGGTEPGQLVPAGQRDIPENVGSSVLNIFWVLFFSSVRGCIYKQSNWNTISSPGRDHSQDSFQEKECYLHFWKMVWHLRIFSCLLFSCITIATLLWQQNFQFNRHTKVIWKLQFSNVTTLAVQWTSISFLHSHTTELQPLSWQLQSCLCQAQLSRDCAWAQIWWQKVPALHLEGVTGGETPQLQPGTVSTEIYY